jgi:hypothetical protein
MLFTIGLQLGSAVFPINPQLPKLPALPKIAGLDFAHQFVFHPTATSEDFQFSLFGSIGNSRQFL